MPAAPSTTSGTLTGAGSVALTKTRVETQVRITITGTYTGLAGVIEASQDGTNYVPVAAVREDTGAFATGSQSIGATNLSYVVRCEGFAKVRFRATAVSTGTAAVRLDAGSFFASPPVAAGNVLSGGTLSGVTLTGTTTVTGDVLPQSQVVSADGAITIKDGVVVITKGSAAAVTLADPTATTDDGKILTVISATAYAHTLSNAAGSGFNGGGSGSDVGTFGGAKGDGIVLMAYQGDWYVVSKTNVTLG